MMVVPQSTGLLSLPNEILIAILSHHSTLSLLVITPTSKALHTLILRIIHSRISSITTLSQHDIILECYHPSMRLMTPHLSCKSISTASLSSSPSTPDLNLTSYHEQTANLTLADLKNLYTTFSVLKPEADDNGPRPHPAGGFFTPLTLISTHATPVPLLSTTDSPDNSLQSQSDNLFTQRIHLESHELFTQLCANIKVVKSGPVPGVYKSCVSVGEGTMRVWRGWLGGQCFKKTPSPGYVGDDKGSEECILWVDSKQDVGLRVRVERIFESGDGNGGGRVDEDEDCDVIYNLSYEELIIRSSRLLLKIERSFVQESENSGKAIIIGSWN